MAKRRKKNGLRNAVLGVACIALSVFLAFMSVKWLRYREARFTRYEEFGIWLPSNYMIHGIDVSRYQQAIAWKEVKNMQVQNVKLGFAFIKATEGEDDADPQFKHNWRAARKHDVPRGAYHFFVPDKDPVKQALNFLKKVNLESGDLPPVLDVEHTGKQQPEQLREKVLAWLQIIEAHYHVKPIIYTNADFYTNRLGKQFDEYPLWVAHYYVQHKPRIGRPWTFWQHNDRGNVNGITAKVDFNVFNGDSTDFRELLIP
ncbi:MAG: glycoside hydrolase family 25 protein [Niabella sp.]